MNHFNIEWWTNAEFTHDKQSGKELFLQQQSAATWKVV